MSVEEVDRVDVMVDETRVDMTGRESSPIRKAIGMEV